MKLLFTANISLCMLINSNSNIPIFVLCLERIELQNSIRSDELEAARKENEIDDKMRTMLKNMTLFIIFLFLLVYICTANMDENVFHQNQDLRNSFEQQVDLVSISVS